MAEPGVSESDRDGSQLERADWWSFAVTSALTLLGYLITLTPEVTLEWSGILTTSAMYGGVGPPAGNPAWTIYSWIFIHLLPFSNPAWRVAVGSAVAAAVSCGLVALMVSRSSKMLTAGDVPFSRLTTREQNWIRGVAGYVAGMALGFSDSFWYEAIVPDFVTFTTLLFTGMLWLLMRWLETGRRRLCWWAFLIFGVLLTNSQEMITALPGMACVVLLFDQKFGRDLCLILLPIATLVTSFTQYRIWDYGLADKPLLAALAIPMLVAIGLIVVNRRVGSEWRSVVACTFCFLLGVGFYLYLPVISATNPPVNWAYPRTLDGFLHSVGRGQFERIQPTHSWSEFGLELWRMIQQTGRQFGWLYVPFAAFPFFIPWRVNIAARQWMGALVLISIGVGPLLAALLNMPSDRQSQELVEMYFFPLRVALALWSGMGLMLFAMKMATFGRDKSLASD